MTYNYSLSNIVQEKLLTPPSSLLSILPLDEKLLKAIYEARQVITNIIEGKDPRLLVIIGPCSLHEEKAALDYAARLKEAAERYQDKLYIVLRAYFSKPRTAKGWKGMVYDPHLDGSQDLEQGLALTRKLLIKLARILPLASEFLDLVSPCYFKDLIAWCAIGARTSASPLHRELASGLPMPVGFKNSIDGNIQTAVYAAESASHPHHYFGLNPEGQPALVETRGNKAAHVILRGSLKAPNYSKEHIQETCAALEKATLHPRLLIDCSHGNSGKLPERQIQVIAELCESLKEQRSGLAGLMIESHLLGGKQRLTPHLTYGQSITDPCLSWEDSEPLLQKLAKELS